MPGRHPQNLTVPTLHSLAACALRHTAFSTDSELRKACSRLNGNTSAPSREAQVPVEPKQLPRTRSHALKSGCAGAMNPAAATAAAQLAGGLCALVSFITHITRTTEYKPYAWLLSARRHGCHHWDSCQAGNVLEQKQHAPTHYAALLAAKVGKPCSLTFTSHGRLGHGNEPDAGGQCSIAWGTWHEVPGRA